MFCVEPVDGLAYIRQVALQGAGFSTLTGFGQSRYSDGTKNRDDRDHNRQFNQRKAMPATRDTDNLGGSSLPHTIHTVYKKGLG